MGIVYMLAYQNLTYIGSTIQTMNKRMSIHRADLKKYLNGTILTYSPYEIVKNENYEVIIIEEIKNETEEDCREREQWWIDFYGKENLVNKCNSNGWDYENLKITEKKKYEKNKEKIKEKKRLRYLVNNNKK